MRLFRDFKNSLVTVDGHGKADRRDPFPTHHRRFRPAFVSHAAGSECDFRRAFKKILCRGDRKRIV